VFRTKRVLLCLASVAALGCSVSNSSPTVPSIESTTFAPSLGIDLASMTHTANGLYYKDTVAGPGAAVTAGQQVSVHYTGYLANGSIFDANGVNNPPLVFTLGAGQVIAGFDQGVAGMHIGGSRLVIIPPDLGYGAVQAGPIPPNSILVFTIQVVSAQ